MAFDGKLADRIRAALVGQPGVVEKRMFGGLAFMLNGNMCVGVSGNELMVRLDPAQAEAALRKPHTRVFDMTGRPMKGWVLVAGDGLKTKAALVKWVAQGVAYADSLPAK